MQLSLQNKVICLQVLFIKSARALGDAWRPWLRLRVKNLRITTQLCLLFGIISKKVIKLLIFHIYFILWKYSQGGNFQIPTLYSTVHFLEWAFFFTRISRNSTAIYGDIKAKEKYIFWNNGRLDFNFLKLLLGSLFRQRAVSRKSQSQVFLPSSKIAGFSPPRCYLAGKKRARFSNSVKNVALRFVLISLFL